jgi:hypothetical protein
MGFHGFNRTPPQRQEQCFLHIPKLNGYFFGRFLSFYSLHLMRRMGYPPMDW